MKYNEMFTFGSSILWTMETTYSQDGEVMSEHVLVSPSQFKDCSLMDIAKFVEEVNEYQEKRSKEKEESARKEAQRFKEWCSTEGKDIVSSADNHPHYATRLGNIDAPEMNYSFDSTLNIIQSPVNKS